jgi:hypothetical protein
MLSGKKTVDLEHNNINTDANEIIIYNPSQKPNSAKQATESDAGYLLKLDVQVKSRGRRLSWRRGVGILERNTEECAIGRLTYIFDVVPNMAH